MPEPADERRDRPARPHHERDARRRLDDATQRQHRFVADASHELRSPLTGIRTQLEVDLLHPEQADWEATERSVLDDTVRLQRLVDDLLVLARTDSAPTDVAHRETVDLDEIVLAEAAACGPHPTPSTPAACRGHSSPGTPISSRVRCATSSTTRTVTPTRP